MKKLSLRDLEVADRRVLVRVDFNVPLRGSEVADDTRVRASLPTIRHLMERGARTVLASHLGRPKKGPDPSQSLAPVARRLASLLGSPVDFAPDCVGQAAEEAAARLKPGGVLLLENLRFHPEEEANDAAFARQLARLAELFVNDAFGTAHRAHASTEGVTRYLSPCAAGFLMEKEIDYLGGVLESPRSPFVAVLGGSKVSGKIDVIEHLLPKVDALLIGGAMAFTFLRALGRGTGRSPVEEDRIGLAAEILAKAGREHVDLRLPKDFRVSASADGSDPGAIAPADAIPADRAGVDVGPATIDDYAGRIRSAGTVLWNGPMGIFEVPAFADGTLGVARAMAEATRAGATTVVGGGDSASAVAQAGLEGSVSHVSTGGGASLEFLEGKTLPGVAALTEGRP
ncbi:MAG: phosphoglycerate kinase [Candidatus Eisenbacteria bacterium]|nr:phosphoglycerate kinase [Candidatus Eisenbacteria bacterium]